MKCPRCGHWNKPTFPRCFQCGEPLNDNNQLAPAWREQFEKPPKEKTRTVYHDALSPDAALPEEASLPPEKAEEPLAVEMNRLKDRRARGAEYLHALRQNAAERGIAPSGARVTIRRSGGFFTDVLDDPEQTLYNPPEIRGQLRGARASVGRGGQRPDPWADSNPAAEDGFFDEDMPPSFDAPIPLAPSRRKRRGGRVRRRARGPVGAAIWTVRALAAFAALFLIWQGVLFFQDRASIPTPAEESAAFIEAIDINGYAGRRILIPGEEGTQIYISELTKSYVVVGGVATIDVPDYVFYDHIPNLDMPEMEVTLTPTLHRNGVETRLPVIRYTVEIPLSPIRLLSPESPYVKVSTSIYNIRLNVEPRSKVTINGKDVSDTVDDDGNVSDNPPVQAIGENTVTITVRAEHCRENNLTVVLYRDPQEIPLELAADTGTRTADEEFTIHATTMAGATVSVEFPIVSLDDSKLGADGTGEFSFVAKMTRVGYNTITIRASAPGKADSIVEHIVYYLPPPEIYTPKAWSLKPDDYRELLNNIKFRSDHAQIYECKGVIREILSSKPQLAIMDTGTDGREQLVLLRNEDRNHTWVEGESYRVFADVEGLYNDMPLLVGRYTYEPLPAN